MVNHLTSRLKIRSVASFTKSTRAQTVLELVFFVIWFVGFFMLAYYFSTAFVVAQKQTMLLRHQAFMELGNYSDYSRGRHGEDDPKKANSQLTFKLGEKTEATRVDLKKNEDFQKAVQGELKLEITYVKEQETWMDVTQNNDEFWRKYEFPRALTSITKRKGSEVDLEIPLSQVMAIAHNRSIKLKSSEKLDSKKTGIFSGGIHFNDFVRMANMELPTERGMRDNQDALKDALRGLAKNDSSLSDEAERLEKSISASDSLSGSAQAALISMAIQVAMQAGLAALSDALGSAGITGGEAGAAGSEAGGAAGNAGGEAAKQASAFDNYLKQLTGNFTSPMQGVQAFADKSLISGPLGSVLAPVNMVSDGVKDFTGGLAAGNFSGLMTAAKGLGEVGQVGAMGGALAGLDTSKLALASAAAQAPSAIAEGINHFEGSINNISTTHIGDVVGALQEIAVPVTAVATMVSPDLGVPLAQVTTALGVVGAASGALDSASNLASGALDAADTASAIGGLLGGVGTAYSGVASLVGADGQPGALLSLAGGVFSAAGNIGATIREMKLNGELVNPGTLVAHLARDNIKNAKEELSGFANRMQENNKVIAQNMDVLLAPNKNLKSDDANALMKTLAKLDKNSDGFVNNQLHGIDGEANKFALQTAVDRLPVMLDKLSAIEAVNGANKAEMTLAMKTSHDQIAVIRESVENLRDVSMGKNNAVIDYNKLYAANLAATNLSNTWDRVKKESEYASAQSKSFETTSQREFIKQTLTYGNMKDAKAFEKEMAGKDAFYGLKSLTGSNRTLDAYAKVRDKQIELQRLQEFAAKAKSVEQARARELDMAKRATQIAESIPMHGPITADNSKAARESASALAYQLRRVANDRSADLNATMAERMKVSAEKLEAIAAGQREFISSKQTLSMIENDLKQREELYDRTKAAFQCKLDGTC